MRWSLKPETKLEQVSGNLLTSLATTGISFLDGSLIAAFLPVLTTSLAAGRHQKRIQNALDGIEQTLASQSDKLRELTDAQYKLVNHTALSILSTVEEQKILYLKAIISGALSNEGIKSVESEILGRWVRDISGDEISFVINHRQYLFVRLSGINDGDPNCFHVDDHGDDELIVSGLIALGILIPQSAEIGGVPSDSYRWSGLVWKLLSLLGYERS